MKQSKFMQFDERNLMLHIRTMYSLFFLLDFRLKRQKVTTPWNLGHSKLVKRNVDAACNKIKVVKIEPFFFVLLIKSFLEERAFQLWWNKKLFPYYSCLIWISKSIEKLANRKSHRCFRFLNIFAQNFG